MWAGPNERAASRASSRSVASLATGCRCTVAPLSSTRTRPSGDTESKSPMARSTTSPSAWAWSMPESAATTRAPAGRSRRWAGSTGSPPVTTTTVSLAPGAAMSRFPPPALPGSGSWVGGVPSRRATLSARLPRAPLRALVRVAGGTTLGTSAPARSPGRPPRYRRSDGAHPLRRRPRALPAVGPRLHRQGDGPPPRGVGGGRDR